VLNALPYTKYMFWVNLSKSSPLNNIPRKPAAWGLEGNPSCPITMRARGARFSLLKEV